MKSYSEYKLELLKMISSLKILELQKNEIRNYINDHFNKENFNKIIGKSSTTDYLNHILKAYGKNNYSIHILLSAFMNFLIFNLVYFVMLIYKDLNLANLEINLFIEFTIFIITILIFPILKLTVRTGLIENWKGYKIFKWVSLIIISFFGFILLTYKINLLNIKIMILNMKFVLPIIILLIIIIQIFFKFFKYDTM